MRPKSLLMEPLIKSSIHESLFGNFTSSFNTDWFQSFNQYTFCPFETCLKVRIYSFSINISGFEFIS